METDNAAAVGGPHHSRHSLYPASPYRAAAAAAGTTTSSSGSSGGDHHTHRALIRLKRDLAEMRQGGELFTCGHALTEVSLPDPQHADRLHVAFKFMQGVFQHAVLKFELAVPPTYPFAPPEICCLTPVWHPHVELRTGRVALPVLGEWRPVLSLSTVLLGLQLLFIEPAADGDGDGGAPPQPPALNPLAAAALREDPPRYAQQVAQTLEGGEFLGVQFPPQRARPQAAAGGVPLAAGAAGNGGGGGAGGGQQREPWVFPSLARKRKSGERRGCGGGGGSNHAVAAALLECCSAPPEEDLEAMRIDDDDEDDHNGDDHDGDDDGVEGGKEGGRAGGGGRSKKRLCCGDGHKKHGPVASPPPPLLAGPGPANAGVAAAAAAALFGAGGNSSSNGGGSPPLLGAFPPGMMGPPHGVTEGPSGLFDFPAPSLLPRQPAPAGAL